MSFRTAVTGGVTYLYSDILGCPHAFTTRYGGVSAKEHLATLNLGENRGDDPENVKENFRRICAAAGLPESVVGAKQIHSTKVLYASAPPEEKPEADGFYTDKEGLTLCVKIADCMPILLYEPEARVIAAVHAGWRGSAANIAAVGVEKLCALGARRENVRAAAGPCIGSCCFEVKDDFVAEFTALLGKKTAGEHLIYRDGRIFADLKGLNRALLLRAGLREEHLDISPLCTCCEPSRFFSHRATGGVRGTMGALIALPAK